LIRKLPIHITVRDDLEAGAAEKPNLQGDERRASENDVKLCGLPRLISAERESFGGQALDDHIRLMSFYICKGVNDHVIWFTGIFPAIKWGPQEQALAFRTKGHAQQALARLPQNASRGTKIVDGDI
jgi:hypothetical protein